MYRFSIMQFGRKSFFIPKSIDTKNWFYITIKISRKWQPHRFWSRILIVWNFNENNQRSISTEDVSNNESNKENVESEPPSKRRSRHQPSFETQNENQRHGLILYFLSVVCIVFSSIIDILKGGKVIYLMKSCCELSQK